MTDIERTFTDRNMEPLCGWPWLAKNSRKKHPEQKMTILYDGKPLSTITSKEKKRSVKAIMEVTK